MPRTITTAGCLTRVVVEETESRTRKMASSSRRREVGGGSSASVKAPSFFKIVLDKALLLGKLDIPEVVVWKHGDCLSSSVFLKVPSGAVWQVELTRSRDKAWLQKGWPEFAKFYGLNHGYILMFTYEGYSHFQVRIFHRNNLEINYPFNANHAEEPNLSGRFQLPKMEELGDDDVIILDSPPPKTREGKALESLRAHKKMQTNSSDKTKAFLRAKRFKSENPFFVVKMQRHTYQRLDVPFVKQHVCAEGICNMNLQSSDGRNWPVKCVVVEYSKKTYAKVYDGWRAFVRENRLKVGDACAFELIDKVTFKVGIYGAKDAV